MRIRKHAKLAGLSLTTVPAGCSAHLNTHHGSSRFHSPRICQLNQSPWDVISFPPDSASSPFQVDGEYTFTANGSPVNSIGAVQSVASMRISIDIEDKNVNSNKGNGIDLGLRNGGTIVCCKPDGKSWQCKKEASRGHSLCEHHLAQCRVYNNILAHPSADVMHKSEMPAHTIRRRGRPRKAPPPAPGNPCEFYYYSGFGPRWGKKRGVTHLAKSSYEVKEDVTVKGIPQPSSSSSQIDSEEFDYVEDDRDDSVEQRGGFGKKRGRKPIKARSLKSLM